MWPDSCYVSFNSFQGNSYLGPTAWVAGHSAMLSNGNATMQCSSGRALFYGSLLPSDPDGAIPGLSGSTAAFLAGLPDY